MNFSIVKLIVTIFVSVLIAFGLHSVVGKAAGAKSYFFMFDVGYFVAAFLISRMVRLISDKRYGMIRSIYLEYVFSFVYFVFCLLNMPVYAHLNFIITIVMIFLWHCKIIKGVFVLVFLVLASFNAVPRWDRLFYILLQTPTAYILSLFFAVAIGDGVSNALLLICPDGKQAIDSKERERHLKWWSFMLSEVTFVDADHDLNLDNVEVRNVKKSERKSLNDTSLLQIQSPAILSESLSRIKQRDGMFSYDRFLKRANTAFIKIQNALYCRCIEEIEHLVSDALFEQFKYLLNEAKKASIRPISVELIINDMQIAQVNLDNNFDVLHLFVRAVSHDYEAGPAEKNLTAEDVRADKRKTLKEQVFCEYWSFMRKPSAKTLDCPGLLEGQCPNCGTPIEVGQVTVCPTCSSFIRSGQYDWVLTKITPASSWVYSEPSLLPGWKAEVVADKNFSVQQVEDRCSVIFWLMRTAEKKKNTDVLKRFATDEFCERLAYDMKNDSFGRYSIIGSAVFESASLKGIAFVNDLDFCYILVVWQVVTVNKKGVRANQPMRDVLVLSRPHKAVTRINNALSSVHCANCGGPLTSSFETNCSFCGSIVNDGSEWILTRVIKESEPEYINLLSSALKDKLEKEKSADPAFTTVLEETSSANDVITISAQLLMADGKVDDKEMAMLRNIAAKYSISEQSLQDILVAVKNGLVYVPVPEIKSFGALKLIQEAAKMALADEELTADEKDAIMNIGMQLGYSKIDVQQIINAELSALRRRRRN